MVEEIAFKISVYAKSDVGVVRSGNEDNFLVLNLSTADTWKPESPADNPPVSLTSFSQSHYGSLIAVTDGMGGALAGEVASRLAVECVRDRMLELQASPSYSKFSFPERLRLSIELANLYVYQMSAKRPEYNGMGATFTAVGLSGTDAYFGQVGDSRAYLIRDRHIQQVTRDQSLVGQLVEAGHLTEEEAERHSYRNVILQALGASPNLNVVIDRLPIRDMDTFALCSDGLSNKLRPDEMKAIIDQSGSLKAACESLINLANERGGEDNITVLIAQVSGGRLKPAEGVRTTALLTSDSGQHFLTTDSGQPSLISDSGQQQKWLERWGAETLPRNPDLPYHIDHDLLDDEEEATLPPEEDTFPPTEKLGE